MQSADRRQLVGLLTADPERVLEEGSQVLAQADATPPVRPLGHVTSSYTSAALGRSIAMALIAGGRGRMGQTLYVPLETGGVAPVQFASPVFYDPKGARLNA
jgi:sarcosine oxidase subunit alpha